MLCTWPQNEVELTVTSNGELNNSKSMLTCGAYVPVRAAIAVLAVSLESDLHSYQASRLDALVSVLAHDQALEVPKPCSDQVSEDSSITQARSVLFLGQ